MARLRGSTASRTLGIALGAALLLSTAPAVQAIPVNGQQSNLASGSLVDCVHGYLGISEPTIFIDPNVGSPQDVWVASQLRHWNGTNWESIGDYIYTFRKVDIWSPTSQSWWLYSGSRWEEVFGWGGFQWHNLVPGDTYTVIQWAYFKPPNDPGGWWAYSFPNGFPEQPSAVWGCIES